LTVFWLTWMTLTFSNLEAMRLLACSSISTTQ
jgi:hypothetical protein